MKKEIDITPATIVPNPEHREFLGRIAAYVFFLFCLIPLLTGMLLPWTFSLTDKPFDAVPLRTVVLIATGGLSAILAFLPAFLVLPSRWLRKGYVFLLFPVSMISLATQSIMYKEFGTQIDSRILGLFQGNFAPLWDFACTEYHIDWVLIGLSVISFLMPWWICRESPRRWAASARTAAVVLIAILVSGSIAFGIHPDIKRVDHYHPSKLSSAPLYQVLSFLGHHYIGNPDSGYGPILKDGGEITTDEYTEISKRLGAEPDAFAERTTARPDWIKKQPSHVFFFFMESIEQDLLENDDLADLAPYIRRFADEGLVPGNFSASSGATVDAIHAVVGGVCAQKKYAVPRALNRFPLDTLPRVMQSAGYKPLFYAASHRIFGNKGDACEVYGYDRFHACAEEAPELDYNMWGANDGDFFEWVVNKELADLQSPHFISFLNVTNHNPHDGPMHELGDYTVSKATMELFTGKNDEEKIRFAKHIKYADWKMGEAALRLRELYPGALFVFMGDHTSSKLSCDPLRQVPFVLWNDSVVDTSVDTSKWWGSQMDVNATLANLVLPDGSTLNTLGHPVWNNDPERVSVTAALAITNDGYMNRKGKWEDKFTSKHRAAHTKLSDEEILARAAAIRAISWGYTNAKLLPPKPKPEAEE